MAAAISVLVATMRQLTIHFSLVQCCVHAVARRVRYLKMCPAIVSPAAHVVQSCITTCVVYAPFFVSSRGRPAHTIIVPIAVDANWASNLGRNTALNAGDVLQVTDSIAIGANRTLAHAPSARKHSTQVEMAGCCFCAAILCTKIAGSK